MVAESWERNAMTGACVTLTGACVPRASFLILVSGSRSLCVHYWRVFRFSGPPLIKLNATGNGCDNV